MISIRRCGSADIASVMKFIDSHWRSGHILARNKAMMDWQHATEQGFNFLLALEGDTILGILGYIPTQRYDPLLQSKNVIWAALWKVRDDCRHQLVGMRLMRSLETIEQNVGIAVNGINDNVVPLYQALGYQVIELSQYYLVNRNIKQRLIANPLNVPLASPREGGVVFARLDARGLHSISLEKNTMSPYKTLRYFAERYLEHPFYEYQLYSLEKAGRLMAIMATRLAWYENACCLRIVDFLGDSSTLGHSGSAFAKLLNELGAEYVDFWQYGIPDRILRSAGFEVIQKGSDIVCPNYFEPFEQKNARIVSCFKGEISDSMVIFRGDGDQDRPNNLEASNV